MCVLLEEYKKTCSSPHSLRAKTLSLLAVFVVQNSINQNNILLNSPYTNFELCLLIKTAIFMFLPLSWTQYLINILLRVYESLKFPLLWNACYCFSPPPPHPATFSFFIVEMLCTFLIRILCSLYELQISYPSFWVFLFFFSFYSVF